MSGEEDGEQRRRYLRWGDDLQAAYLAALEQCGGLQNARPKALLDLLQPRFPVLTLQHVKNHLQKQRTKEAKAGAGGAPPSYVTRNKGRATEGDAAAVSRGGSGDSHVPGPPAAPGPTLWLPDSFAQQQRADVSASESDALIDLARRALTTTVHQLALFRKLLEELEEVEDDHAQLLAALRRDPSGRSLLLGAQDDAAGSDGQPVRLRRLLPRLLPPNPFSSGPKAEAALKLAAWMTAERDAGGPGRVPPSLAAPDAPQLGGDELHSGGGSAEPWAAAGAAATEQGGSGAGAAAAPQPALQPRKRHKALSELLAEIPLAAPPAPPWPAAAPGGGPAAAGHALQPQLAGGRAGLSAQGLASLPAPLLQQGVHLPQQAQQAPGGPNPFGGPAWQAQQAEHGAVDVAMQQVQQPAGAQDSLMLCSLDAEMSSLLLHSMSQVLAQAALVAGGGGGGGAAEPLAEAAPPPSLADLPLATGKVPAEQIDLSVLRSVLDMLSSGSAQALLAPNPAPVAPSAPGCGGGTPSAAALPGVDGSRQGPGGQA